jgi:hypothetical protein
MAGENDDEEESKGKSKSSGDAYNEVACHQGSTFSGRRLKYWYRLSYGADADARVLVPAALTQTSTGRHGATMNRDRTRDCKIKMHHASGRLEFLETKLLRAILSYSHQEKEDFMVEIFISVGRDAQPIVTAARRKLDA